MINIKINGVDFSGNENETILDVCLRNNIDIPTLCYHEDQKNKANCRICVVEVIGVRTLKTSCSTLITNNMEILTESEKVKEAREINFQLLLANHPLDCDNCEKDRHCDFQKLAHKLQIKKTPFLKTVAQMPFDESNVAIKRDLNKCIKCNRCLEVCKDVQGLHIIEKYDRSNFLKIGTPNHKPLSEMLCTYCGQCSAVCPASAITEVNDLDKVKEVLNDNTKHVIVQIAPAIRATICESLGFSYDEFSINKLIGSLRKMGFDKVFDTNFAADLTVIEESYELIERLKSNQNLPQFTSCCPGWINYVELYYPHLIPNLSTCKSPQQMFGALAKNYYSTKIDKDPKDIVVVAIMPCTAKKYEAKRIEMENDVDIVLTTREFQQMFDQYEFEVSTIIESDFDQPFGITTGAGTIFGNTGGVMIAALRTTYEILTKTELKEIDFKELSGFEKFKEATININGNDIKVAVVHSLIGAKEIIQRIEKNPNEYAFIEVMCCLGGCIGGGGQPNNTKTSKEKRKEILMMIDKNKEIRKAHQNEAIISLYQQFLKYPLSPLAHKLLHTTYTKRDIK